ncbi:replication initiator protein [robinz microvirus RP_105]|nr:replication initiator protein [robinz microvirus RP_105]
MACYGPLTAYYTAEYGKSGKRGITFDRKRSLSGVPFSVPCGRCIGCRLNRALQWSIRCMHEKQLHSESCFITLTYNDDNLPYGSTLVGRDLTLFMKRLRKAHGPVRFFAAGEYGDTTQRPHYHILLLNRSFPDLVKYAQGKTGEPLYTSKALAKLWTFGDHYIGAVTPDSCAYVARYCLKKVTGDKASAHYEAVTDYGEIVMREAEFARWSIALAKEWYAKYGKGVRDWDTVVVDGQEIPPPKFYDSLLEKVDPDAYATLKVNRRRRGLLKKADNTTSRLRVRETLHLRKIAMFKQRTFL